MGTSKNNCLHSFVFEKEVATIMRIVDSVKNERKVFVSKTSSFPQIPVAVFWYTLGS